MRYNLNKYIDTNILYVQRAWNNPDFARVNIQSYFIKNTIFTIHICYLFDSSNFTLFEISQFECFLWISICLHWTIYGDHDA